jgi:hypothetical protein
MLPLLCRLAAGLGLALTVGAALAQEPRSVGNWPMVRGNLLRNNRAGVRGTIAGSPALAWRHEVGNAPAAAFTADLDDDGRSET